MLHIYILQCLESSYFYDKKKKVNIFRNIMGFFLNKKDSNSLEPPDIFSLISSGNAHLYKPGVCTTGQHWETWPRNSSKCSSSAVDHSVHVFCLHWIIFLMSDPIVLHFYLLIFIAGQNSAALGNTGRLNGRLHQSHHMTQLR